MIKQTIEISREPAHLAARLKQLVLKRGEEQIRSFPCEDIGALVVDHPQVTYTHGALTELLAAGSALVVCGDRHLPVGVLIPLGDHTEVVWRVRDQAAAAKPVLKQLWKQLIQAKIGAQAANLKTDSAPFRRLKQLAQEVRSGDPTNREAQAARIYWSAWLMQPDAAGSPPRVEFRRDPDGDGLNGLLNYGYAIIRAALARAIVAAGLHPALGIKHSNRSNAFALADDLIEPLRPMVDRRARQLFWSGHEELDQPTKAQLLELLSEDVQFGAEHGPLLVNLHRYIASLVRCYQGNSKVLEIPLSCS